LELRAKIREEQDVRIQLDIDQRRTQDSWKTESLLQHEKLKSFIDDLQEQKSKLEAEALSKRDI